MEKQKQNTKKGENIPGEKNQGEREKRFKKLFDEKWKCFLDFEKSEFDAKRIYYWKKHKKILILTDGQFLRLKPDFENPIWNKIIELIKENKADHIIEIE